MQENKAKTERYILQMYKTMIWWAFIFIVREIVEENAN